MATKRADRDISMGKLYENIPLPMLYSGLPVKSCPDAAD